MCQAGTAETTGMTTGTPYGPPWEQPTPPDLGEVRLDVGARMDVPPTDIPPPGVSVDDLTSAPPASGPAPDPAGLEGWRYDLESEIWWRPATPREVRDNQWRAGAIVLVDLRLARALRQELRVLTVHIPLPSEVWRAAPDGGADGPRPQEVATLLLDHRADHEQTVVVEAAATPDGRTFARRARPSFAFYLSRGGRPGVVLGPAGEGARAWAGPGGSVDLLGRVADRMVRLQGPLHRARLELPSPAPAGGVFVQTWADPVAGFALPAPPLAATPEQCMDGLDNDPDGAADACDGNCVLHPAFDGARYGPVPPTLEHARSVALVGDAIWCAANSETWATTLMARAQDAAQHLNWIEVPPEYDVSGRPPPVVVRDLACVLAPSEAAAAQCHRKDDPSARTGVLAGYPLQGVGNLGPDFLWKAWDYFVWLLDGAGAFVAEGAQPIPVSLVQVVTGEPGIRPTEGSLTLVEGIAYATHYKPQNVQSGASVVVADPPILKPCLGAHELGHTLGLPHDLGGTMIPGVGTVTGLMRFDGGDCAPLLGERDFAHAPDWSIADEFKSPSYHPYQAWSEYASDKRFPRWDGFAYVGCDEDTVCPLGLACKSLVTGGPACF